MIKHFFKATWKTWVAIIVLTICAINCNGQDLQVITLGTGVLQNQDGSYSAHYHFEIATSREDRNEIGVYFSIANSHQKYVDYGLSYYRNIRIIDEDNIETLFGFTSGLLMREYESSITYFDVGIQYQIRYWYKDWIAGYCKLSAGPRLDQNRFPNQKMANFDIEIGIVIEVFKNIKRYR